MSPSTSPKPSPNRSPAPRTPLARSAPLPPLPPRPEGLSQRPPLAHPLSSAGEKHILFWEGMAFAAYNTSELPLVPARRGDLPPIRGGMTLPKERYADYVWPGAYPRVAWASNKYPLMGFSPRHPSFNGRMFERLRGGMKIKRSALDRFELDEETKERWSILEAILRRIIHILERKLPSVEGIDLWPLETSEPRLPSSFGFTGTRMQFKSENDARESFKMARNAFLSLIATASGLVALHRYCERYAARRNDEPPGQDTWARDLVISGIPAFYVQELLQSEVCARVQRVGLIVRMESCHFLSKLPAFIHQGLPVWFYLGSQLSEYPMRNPWTTTLLPSPAEVERLAIRVKSLDASRLNERTFDSISAGADNSLLDNDIAGTSLPTLPQDSASQDASISPGANEPPLVLSKPWAEENANVPQSKSMPMPFPHTGQLAGETFEEFFRRRNEDDSRRMATETAEETATRERHRLQVESQGQPGARGAHVYEWVLVDGFYLRQRVNRNDVADVWSEYAASQRKYDPFRKQWDLCRAFDEGAEVRVGMDADSEDDDDDEDELIGAFRRGVGCSSGSNFLEHVEQTVSGHVISNEVEEVPPSTFVKDFMHDGLLEKAELHLTLDCAAVLARERFGYSPDEAHMPRDLQMITDASKKMKWREATFLMHMFEGVSDETFPSGADVINIRALIHELEKTDWLYTDRLPASLCDLSSQNKGYVLQLPGQHLSIKILRHHWFTNVKWKRDEEIEEPLPCNTYVRGCEQINTYGRDVFVFQLLPSHRARDNGPARQECEWVVGVVDAISAVQGLRTQSRLLYELVRYFVARGIPFHTLSTTHGRVDAKSIANERSGDIDLGWRHVSLKPGLEDYDSFERRFAAFLSDNPRARAVICRGGLLWRLAVEIIGINEATAMALAGPSPYRFETVYSTVNYPLAAKSDVETWWDDTITDAEENLLCGAHKMYRGT